MSATDVLAPGRSDVLPGHVLSPFPLSAMGEMESEFNRTYCADLVSVSLTADPDSWERAMEFSAERLKERPIAFGTLAFDRMVLANASTPLMAYLSLRVTEPTITRAAAKALLTDEFFLSVRSALLDFLGFSRPKIQPPTKGAMSPSTGDYYTSSSGAPASTPPPSVE